jgi:hypothetical protein
VPRHGKIVNRPFGAGTFAVVRIDSTQQMWADAISMNSRGMITMKTLLASAAAMALSAGMAVADYKLTILHTNDFHARFEPISKYDSGCGA